MVVALVALMVLLLTLVVDIGEVLLGLERLYEAIVLFDVAHDLELSSCVEGVARSSKKLHKMRSYVSASKVHPLCRVRDRVTFVDSARVSDAITAIEDNTSGQSASVQR